MSSYKSFAIVGFGELGSRIVDEFLKGAQHSGSGPKLRVLTRSKNKPELASYLSKGVDIIPVDYSSSQSITHALADVDVVISTLRDDGLDLQTDVVRAAQVAGVKLFVPSEYGRNTLGETSDYLKIKAETHTLLKELGLPYTLFFTGIWPEMMFVNSLGPFMGIHFDTGKFELFGEGNMPITWTSPRSIASFVHHVVTTLPASQLENRAFKIEGDRKTFREIIGIWEAKHQKQAQVTVMTEAEIQAYKDAQTSDLFKLLPDGWRDGSFLIGGDDNKEWPQWRPLTWVDLMA